MHPRANCSGPPTRSSKVNVAGIVLAAGQSTRMGVPKLLLPIRGQPMVRVVAECLLEAGLNEVIVVVHPGQRGIDDVLHGLAVQWAFTEASPIGMGHSIAAGVSAASRSPTSFLIALADMPDVLPTTVRALLENGSSERIVVPRFQAQMGHPVHFGADFRADLIGLAGDEGARRILQAYPDRVHSLDVDDPGVLRDYDVPEDLE